MKRLLCFALALVMCLLLFTGAALAAPAEAGVYYQQLTPPQKELYDFLNEPKSLELLIRGETLTLPVLSGSYASPSDIDMVTRAFEEDIPYAFAAFEAEHPELFWLSGYQTSISGGYSDRSYTLYRSITVNPYVNWASGERSAFEDSNRLRYDVQAVADLAAGEAGTYAQLLFVHDYLTDTNIYNEAAAMGSGNTDRLPWTPLSALEPDLSPVCEGYARAFKLICDALNIPCILVDGRAGGEHMWNQVKLDGQWYAVDVTFDDPVVEGVKDVYSGAETHSYFLVGSDTPVQGDTTFAENHTVIGERLPGVRMNVPAISRTAYDPAANRGSGDEPAVNVRVGETAVVWTDAAPFIDANNRTMVPLRAVADALGLEVGWDGSAREASFSDGTKTLIFPIDSSVARTGDGGEVQMDTAAVIVNSRTYAPIRYLAEFFGHSVGWLGETKTVTID